MMDSYRRRAALDRLAPGRSRSKSLTKLTPSDEARMRDCRGQPGGTLRELQGKLSVRVAKSTVCRALRQLGLSLKNSR